METQTWQLPDLDLLVDPPPPLPSRAGHTFTELVLLKDVLTSPRFTSRHQSVLPIALGRTDQEEVETTDLADHAVMLASGPGGRGKSVFLNAVICSLLMRETPSEIALILVDPTGAELTQYGRIPHLLTDPIVDGDMALNAIGWLAAQVEDRFATFSGAGVRNLEDLNSRPGAETAIPRVILVVDEILALRGLGGELEHRAMFLAERGRAVGIHMVFTTQWGAAPLLKQLDWAVTGRISFGLSPNGEWLAPGRFMWEPIAATTPVEVRGVLALDEEIEGICRHWRGQGRHHPHHPEITAADPASALPRESRWG